MRHCLRSSNKRTTTTSTRGLLLLLSATLVLAPIIAMLRLPISEMLKRALPRKSAPRRFPFTGLPKIVKRIRCPRILGSLRIFSGSAPANQEGKHPSILPATLESIPAAVDALHRGEVIAVATDTIYGLAVDAANEEAVQKIYRIKGRDKQKPLAISVGSLTSVEEYGVTNVLPNDLLGQLLPGPVTVVLQRNLLCQRLSGSMTNDTIALRIPNTKFMQKLASDFGGALALTSANLSGEPSCRRIRDFEGLWKSIAVILQDVEMENDAGRLTLGSTIIDLSRAGEFRILRKGEQDVVAHIQKLLIDRGLHESA